MNDNSADRELVAVFNQLVEAGHETKQAAWATPRGPSRDALAVLGAFVFAQAAAVADAEAAIDGRSLEMVSPSEQPSPNLIADAHAGAGRVVPLLIERVRAAAAEVRTRAARIAGSDVATLLYEIADGLDQHLDVLVSAERSPS